MPSNLTEDCSHLTEETPGWRDKAEHYKNERDVALEEIDYLREKLRKFTAEVNNTYSSTPIQSKDKGKHFDLMFRSLPVIDVNLLRGEGGGLGNSVKINLAHHNS